MLPFAAHKVPIVIFLLCCPHFAAPIFAPLLCYPQCAAPFAASIVLPLLCCPYCAASIVMSLLCCPHCAASTVMPLLCCLHCDVPIVLPPFCLLYCAAPTLVPLLYCLHCDVPIVLPLFCSLNCDIVQPSVPNKWKGPSMLLHGFRFRPAAAPLAQEMAGVHQKNRFWWFHLKWRSRATQTLHSIFYELWMEQFWYLCWRFVLLKVWHIINSFIRYNVQSLTQGNLLYTEQGWTWNGCMKIWHNRNSLNLNLNIFAKPKPFSNLEYICRLFIRRFNSWKTKLKTEISWHWYLKKVTFLCLLCLHCISYGVGPIWHRGFFIWGNVANLAI